MTGRPGDIYPWLQPAWRRLLDYRRSGRLPQALLLTGRSGLGKRHLAEAFAALLLCRHGADEPCLSCVGCKLWLAGTHPDFLLAEPEEPGKAILIDQVREVTAKLALKSQFGGARVVLLAPADALNAAAANALLKTLEEPPPDTLLLLLSARPSRMAPTLVSRCQRLPLAAPQHGVALAWLQSVQPRIDGEAALAAAGGAPLRSLEATASGLQERRTRLFALWPTLRQDRFNVAQAAEKLSDVGVDIVADWLYTWITDAMKLAAGAAPDTLLNRDRLTELREVGSRLSSKEVGRFIDTLVLRKREAMENAQLNRVLLLEALLLAWAGLAAQHL